MESRKDQNTWAAASLIESAHQLYSKGKLKAAWREINHAAILTDLNHHALHLAGVIALGLKKPLAAKNLLQKSVALQPNASEAWSNLAAAQLNLRLFRAALTAAQKAVELDHANYSAQCNLAEALMATDDTTRALSVAEMAISLNQKPSIAWTIRGRALARLGSLRKAVDSYQNALAIAPNNPAIYNNLAVAFAKAGQLEEAIHNCNRAIALDPLFNDARLNLANNLCDLGRFSDARHQLEIIIEQSPKNADAHFALSKVLLQIGELSKGWAEYEWRKLATTASFSPITSTKPEWNGSPTSQRVLLFGEQGVGDQILFCSLITDAKNRAGNLVVALDERLIPPMQRALPAVDFRPYQSGRNGSIPHDYQLALGSLGKLFRTSAAQFGNNRTYLCADIERVTSIRNSNRLGRLVIGISWRSGNKKYGREKSLALPTLLAPLLDLPAQFMVLQYGDVTTDLSTLDNTTRERVVVPTNLDRTHDLDGVLAASTACNYIVTVSNSVAHLAGAAGLNTAVIVPEGRGKFWYWHTAERGGRSLWYPSVSVLGMQHNQTPGSLRETVMSYLS